MACLFCKIAQAEIPATIVYDDEDVMAFRDVSPQAPTHILVIPKKHIATINDVEIEDQELLGHMVCVAKKIAKEEGLSEPGYRLVFNVNSHGGQAVYHIHLHILGGRQFAWPPG